MNGLLRENIIIALRAIKSNLLRTVLTIVIISVGILSLVGTLTCIDAIKTSINSNFTSMGANTFTIRNREMSLRIGRGGKKPKKYRPISYDEAVRFTNEFNFPATASVSTMASMIASLKFGSEKSNPNIQVMGGDENYLLAAGYEVERGRNFSLQEASSGAHVVIVGKDIVTTLFKKREKPLDQVITIGSGKYKIIGVLKEKGSSMAFGGDKICIIPLQNAKTYFSRPNMSFTLSVIAQNSNQLESALGEATGLFRKIRKLPVGEEDNFEIMKSDGLANMLISNLANVTMGATLIAIITLLGAAIGLMNIMLVSVTERTREIGIRKSIGATRKTIRNQFLIEAVVICQLGGLFGILFAVLAGFFLSLAMSVSFSIPWNWISLGVSICFIVGLISGIYPAIKASKLDPIEALRFE